MHHGFRKEAFTFDNCPDGIRLSVKACEFVVGKKWNKIIYCLALRGEYCPGKKNVKLTTWPLTDDKNKRLYDSLQTKGHFYIRDDAQVYPLCVVHYRGIKGDD